MLIREGTAGIGLRLEPRRTLGHGDFDEHLRHGAQLPSTFATANVQVNLMLAAAGAEPVALSGCTMCCVRVTF